MSRCVPVSEHWEHIELAESMVRLGAEHQRSGERATATFLIAEPRLHRRQLHVQLCFFIEPRLHEAAVVVSRRPEMPQMLVKDRNALRERFRRGAIVLTPRFDVADSRESIALEIARSAAQTQCGLVFDQRFLERSL